MRIASLSRTRSLSRARSLSHSLALSNSLCLPTLFLLLSLSLSAQQLVHLVLELLRWYTSVCSLKPNIALDPKVIRIENSALNSIPPACRHYRYSWISYGQHKGVAPVLGLTGAVFHSKTSVGKLRVGCNQVILQKNYK